MSVITTSHIAVFVNRSGSLGSEEPYGVLGLLLQETDETGAFSRVLIRPDRMIKSLATSLNDDFTRQSTNQGGGKKTVHFAPNAEQGDPAGSESSTAVSGESSKMTYDLLEGNGVMGYAKSKVIQLQKELFPESTFGNPSVSFFSRESDAKDSLDTLQDRTKGREVKSPVE